MEKIYVNKHRMLTMVKTFLHEYPDKLQAIPGMGQATAEFDELMGRMDAAILKQMNSSVGYTETTEMHKQQLIGGMLELIHRAKALAVMTNDTILKADVDYSRTRLIRLPQGSLLAHCSRVKDICTERRTEMSDYGLTDEMLEKVELAMEKYRDAVPGTKTAIASRKTATLAIRSLFAEMDRLLRKMDVLMALVSFSDKDLLMTYKNMRMIIDL